MKEGRATNFQSEEDAAVQALNVSFRTSLSRYFRRRIGNSVEADDMVQEVFVRLLKRGSISSVENVHAYVFETASNVLKDRLRNLRSRLSDAHDVFESEQHGGVDFSPEDVLLERERLAQAIDILSKLPERTRTIFVLRRLDGMRYRDISTRLGISVSAVEKHMERAMARLVEGLNRR